MFMPCSSQDCRLGESDLEFRVTVGKLATNFALCEMGLSLCEMHLGTGTSTPRRESMGGHEGR